MIKYKKLKTAIAASILVGCGGGGGGSSEQETLEETITQEINFNPEIQNSQKNLDLSKQIKITITKYERTIRNCDIILTTEEEIENGFSFEPKEVRLPLEITNFNEFTYFPQLQIPELAHQNTTYQLNLVCFNNNDELVIGNEYDKRKLGYFHNS